MARQKLGQRSLGKQRFFASIIWFLLCSACDDSLQRSVDSSPTLACDLPHSTLFDNDKSNVGSPPEVIFSDFQGWPVGIVEHRAPNTKIVDKLVVYFHGGPRSPFIDEAHRLDLEKIYGGDRTTIAFVAYSGTDAPWFKGSTRLREKGLSALHCDSLAAENYVQSVMSVNGKNVSVVVVGGSFGAVAALQLFANLGSSADGLVLTSPWLFPLTIDELVNNDISYVSNDLILSGSNRRQIEKDALDLYSNYLGISPRLDGTTSSEIYLSEMLSKSCPFLRENSLILIPQHEDRSNREKTLQYFRDCAQPAAVISVNYSFHGMEYSFPWVRSLIGEFLK